MWHEAEVIIRGEIVSEVGTRQQPHQPLLELKKNTKNCVVMHVQFGMHDSEFKYSGLKTEWK